MADLENVRIPHSELKIGKELGRGAFGYFSTLNYNFNMNRVINEAIWKNQGVAVKKLIIVEDEDGLSDDQLNTFSEFRREVWLMR